MSMRVVALLASLLVVAVAQGQSSFPDVPDRHWAEESVERLGDLGILMGFPDGTFRGNESITRYEAALVIDRLLTAVRDESAAADAALENQVSTLRAVVMALADESEELQRRAGANRDAIDALWTEVRALREELGLPPPAPLPPFPPAVSDEDAPDVVERSDEEREPGARPDADAAAPDAPVAEDVPDEAGAQSPDDALPGLADDAPGDEPQGPADPERAGDEAVEAAPEPRPADDALAPVAAMRQPTAVYASVAAGGALPRRWLVRATVGAENLVANGFGARLSLDLGRRSSTPLASATLLGHATYRLADPDPVGGYVGAGMGLHFGGDGALASVLAGGTWSGLDPVVLFVETTLDMYLARELPMGGSRFAPTVAAGARWTF